MTAPGCKCQKCGTRYKVDIMIPDNLWARISPKKPPAGLLCGKCIINELEKLGFNAFKLTKI